MKGRIFMLPVTLGSSDHLLTIPSLIRDKALSIRLFAVEEIRTARRYLRSLDKGFPIDESLFFEIGKHSRPEDLSEFFSRVIDGVDAGVMSEAGMPGLADPGSIVAAEAHRRGIRVIPCTGPSSIMLALVASGLNGQAFEFHGYLPVDSGERTKRIRDIEKKSLSGTTQIFMETPFRTDKVLGDILLSCKPTTRLCIASDVTLGSEDIRTMTIETWRKERPVLDKRLVVFLLLA